MYERRSGGLSRYAARPTQTALVPMSGGGRGRRVAAGQALV